MIQSVLRQSVSNSERRWGDKKESQKTTKPETQIHGSWTGKVPGECALSLARDEQVPSPKGLEQSGPLPSRQGADELAGEAPMSSSSLDTQEEEHCGMEITPLRGPGPLSLCARSTFSRALSPTGSLVHPSEHLFPTAFFSHHPVNFLRACLHSPAPSPPPSTAKTAAATLFPVLVPFLPPRLPLKSLLRSQHPEAFL